MALITANINHFIYFRYNQNIHTENIIVYTHKISQIVPQSTLLSTQSFIYLQVEKKHDRLLEAMK